MKRVLFLFIIFICMNAQNNKEIKLNDMPNSLEEFITLRNRIATTPEGGAAIFIIALKSFADKKDWGEKALVIAVDRYNLIKGNVYKGFDLSLSVKSFLKRTIAKQPYIPNSYFAGSSPENNYSVKAPYKLKFFTTKYTKAQSSGDKVKLMVECSGARPRPVVLKKNNKGIYKAYEFSSLYVGVKAVSVEVDDDL